MKRVNAGKYTIENSYYASAELDSSILDCGMVNIIHDQVKAANERALKARYRGKEPPGKARDLLWDILIEAGVGALNVDDLDAVSKRWW